MVSRSSSPRVLDKNVPTGAPVFPQYRGDGPGSQSLANRRVRGRLQHLRELVPTRALGVWVAGALPAWLPPSCVPVLPSLMASALRITFHPVNPAETALWTHGSPHKGERARLLGPEGHLTLMNLMNLTAVGGPK